jgi:hypothetical protein
VFNLIDDERPDKVHCSTVYLENLYVNKVNRGPTNLQKRGQGGFQNLLSADKSLCNQSVTIKKDLRVRYI